MTTTEPQHEGPTAPTGTPTSAASNTSAALRLPLSAGFFSTEVAAHLGLSRFVLLGFAASIGANVLLSAALLFKTPPQTVVVVPPEAGFSGDMGVSLQTAYRVDENGPDARLLERTAMTLIQMIATVTPETGRTQIARFLEHVDPEVASKLEVRLLRELKSLTEDHAASVFYPLEAKTERRAMTVTVTGRQKLVLGTKVVTDAKKSWRLRFRHAAGRLFLTGVEEASAD